MVPEFDLGMRARVVSSLQSRFGVLLEHILDLALPGDDRGLQDMGLVLVALVVISGDVRGWERKESSSFNLTNGDIDLTQEEIESIHEVLRHEV